MRGGFRSRRGRHIGCRRKRNGNTRRGRGRRRRIGGERGPRMNMPIMEKTSAVMDLRKVGISGNTRLRLVHSLLILGGYTTRRATSGNGPARRGIVGMGVKKRDVPQMIRAAPARCGAAPGATDPRGCVRPTAAGASRPTGSAAGASVSPDPYKPLFFILFTFIARAARVFSAHFLGGVIHNGR